VHADSKRRQSMLAWKETACRPHLGKIKSVIQWKLVSLKNSSFKLQITVAACASSPQLSQFDPNYFRFLLLTCAIRPGVAPRK